MMIIPSFIESSRLASFPLELFLKQMSQLRLCMRGRMYLKVVRSSQRVHYGEWKMGSK